ncbi:lipase 3-like [Drosophila innubila]|uniref:lipase 3-like n=1 Tax=Drosophila innubila TaxID=198719 RepID=UPI00148B4E25|nr:lipase 3-like [Drosophila innubila]
MQKQLVLVLILLVSTVFAAQILKRTKDKTTSKLIKDHGYPAEDHRIETEDGNVLQAFRIPYSHKLQNQNKTRPIVLLQHGLMSSSDIWVLSGPDNALAYLLADSGFDVWIGNNRGNEYSLELKEPSWNFSWHEIGLYDISAMIDYALKTNGQGQKSIHYVGHSQGTTVFFTLMSLRPEYNQKIKTSHMLSPVAIMKNTKNECVVSAANFYTADGMLTSFNRDTKFLNIFRSKSNTFNERCVFLMDCYNMDKKLHSEHANKTAIKEADKISADGSWNQVLHYLFNHKSGYFRQFDYDSKKNLEVYKSKQPPEYPVEKITSEVHLWYVDNDDLVDPVDVLALADRLPNKVLHHIQEPIFGHADYTIHNDIRKYVNDPVINIMHKYELDKEK